MTLSVLSGVAQVNARVTPPGRVELYAMRPAGANGVVLVVEAYEDDELVAGGEVVVWELNQALAALMSESIQARRLSLRDDGRHHGGYLDVLCDGPNVALTATSRDGLREVAFAAATSDMHADLTTLLHHYLTLTKSVTAGHTIVLPDAISSRALAPR